jgi:hypothetical protein
MTLEEREKAKALREAEERKPLMRPKKQRRKNSGKLRWRGNRN